MTSRNNETVERPPFRGIFFNVRRVCAPLKYSLGVCNTAATALVLIVAPLLAPESKSISKVEK